MSRTEARTRKSGRRSFREDASLGKRSFREAPSLHTGMGHALRSVCSYQETVEALAKDTSLSARDRAAAILRMTSALDEGSFDVLAATRLLSILGKLSKVDPQVRELFLRDNRLKTRTFTRIAAHCKNNTLPPAGVSAASSGLAHLQIQDQELLDLLSVRARRVMRRCSPNDISSIAWAQVSLKREDKLLFAEISRVAKSKINEFIEGPDRKDGTYRMDISTLLRSFAISGAEDDGLFSDMAPVAAANVAANAADFGTQSFANIASAYSVKGCRDKMRREEMRRNEMRLTKEQEDEKQKKQKRIWHLFITLSRWALQKKLETFKEQERTNFISSFATLGYRDDRLFAEAARTIKLKLPAEKMPPQGLAMTARAFAIHGLRDEELFDLIADAVMTGIQKDLEGGVRTFTPQDITHLSSAFAELNIRNEKLFRVLADEALRQKENLLAPDFALLSRSFGVHSPELCREFLLETRELWQAIEFPTGNNRAMHQAQAVAGLRDPDDYTADVQATIREEQRAKRELNDLETSVWQPLHELQLKTGQFEITIHEAVAASLTDFTLRYKDGKKLIIESDGDEFHLLKGSSGVVPTGADVLQDRLFSMSGWHILHIPESIWESLDSAHARLDWLSDQIDKALAVQPGAFQNF